MEKIPEGAKLCRGCDRVKPIEAFRLKRDNYAGKSYRNSRCRACERRSRSEWYHDRGGREVVSKRRKGKRPPSKNKVSTPLQRLRWAQQNTRKRIRRLQENLECIEREITRMKGDMRR